MNKKIVIVPVFCETHLIKLQIDNIFNTINPDILVYNEGMFPHGPESCTNMDGFKEKYTLDGKGKRGFDYPELQEIVFEAQKKYKDKKIILNEMEYDPNEKSATKHYINACSNFKDLNIDINVGDYIFPFEGDVFHLESNNSVIKNYMEQLTPDTGFKSIWIDFIENQYYADMSTLKPFIMKKDGRSRKICIRYGTMDFYRNTLSNFESQKYPSLYPTDLITFHYCWFRKDKYLQLRFDQLNRPSYYWKYFKNGIDYINQFKYAKVCIRPDKTGTYRDAMIVDMEHPEAIKSHPNYNSNPNINIKNIIENNEVLDYNQN
jgi:hypothetical protein